MLLVSDDSVMSRQNSAHAPMLTNQLSTAFREK